MKQKIKICIIVGTRPEIIKMSSIIREFSKKNENYFIIHTKQHYSENLDKIFFQELKLPSPKYNLNIGSGTHASQTGKMLISIEKVLLKEKPDLVIVEGDTNTVLAGALVASKLHIKIAHIEAGLRSYFREMPEEINRILTDHMSDFLFAPTKKASKILINEGIDKKRIFVTGNTIVDAVYQNKKIAEKSKVLSSLRLSKQSYLLLTSHREENVDSIDNLRNILESVERVAKKINLPVVYPIHPRTKKMISKFKLNIPNEIVIINPLGYLDFLSLQQNAKLIFTDSGGIQEEACILNVPCVTLRENTERPETLDVGSNVLAGTNIKRVIKSTTYMLNKKTDWKNPYGDGKAYKRIANIIAREIK